MLGVLDLSKEFSTALIQPGNLANGNKTGVRINGGGVPCNAFLFVGAGGGSAVVTVQESDDNITFTNAVKTSDGTDAVFTVGAGNANTPMAMGINRGKPYLRAVVSGVSGTVGACLAIIEGKIFVAAPGANSGTWVDG